MAIFSRRRAEPVPTDIEPGVHTRQSSEDTLPVTAPAIEKSNSSQAYYSKPTFLRLFTALLYLAALIFIILVEIGNINNKSVIRSTYFLQLNLANIIPESVPDAVLINSIAQSIGLHDFYQVGLWNYCAGYNGQGITYCSPRVAGYWFNPVQIITSELLVGATIALPTEVNNILHIVHTASVWMFACFMVGAVLTFLCIFLIPLSFSKKPRWEHKARRIFCRQLPATVLSFLALLFTAAGAVIATVMFVIFRNAFSSVTELNILATLGVQMLAFEWVAVGLLLLGFIMQIGTCCGVCCCTGRKRAERREEKRRSRMIQQEEKVEGTRTI